MGDDLRRDYAGMGCTALRNALGKRRKVVVVSTAVCRAWVRHYSAPAPEPAAAAGAASSSGILTNLVGAKAVEDAVGARYRQEVTDIGLGTAGRNMKARLRTWGYEVPREACQDMLWSSRNPAQAAIETTLKKETAQPSTLLTNMYCKSGVAPWVSPWWRGERRWRWCLRPLAPAAPTVALC